MSNLHGKTDLSHKQCTSVYRYNPEAQPKGYPTIYDSRDGAGMGLVVRLLVRCGTEKFLEYVDVGEVAGVCIGEFIRREEDNVDVVWGGVVGEMFFGKEM